MQPIILHVSCLSFDRAASLKLPPGKNVAMALCEEMVTDGFVTSGEPLLITVPAALLAQGLMAPWCTEVTRDGTVVVEPAHQLLAQSIGYSKGQARVLASEICSELRCVQGIGEGKGCRAPKNGPETSALVPLAL